MTFAPCCPRYLLTVLDAGREVLGGEAILQVPQHNDALLIADQDQVVVDGTQLQADYLPRVSSGGGLHSAPHNTVNTTSTLLVLTWC